MAWIYKEGINIIKRKRGHKTQSISYFWTKVRSGKNLLCGKTSWRTSLPSWCWSPGRGRTGRWSRAWAQRGRWRHPPASSPSWGCWAGRPCCGTASAGLWPKRFYRSHISNSIFVYSDIVAVVLDGDDSHDIRSVLRVWVWAILVGQHQTGVGLVNLKLGEKYTYNLY